MDEYLKAEKRLAELLGFKGIREIPLKKQPLDEEEITALISDEPHCSIPQWCRAWSACGPLMVEYKIHPFFGDVFCAAGNVELGDCFAQISDHPDRDTAVRFAIVQAVIAKLEANNV